MLPAPLRRLLLDRFLLGLLAAVVAATAAPGLARSGGPLHADRAADAGVFLIFLFHGLSLSRDRLGSGMRRWRLHLAVQGFTFVVFPALALAAQLGLRGVVRPDLLLGFVYLCTLPSTLSSSVAMTAVARGNVPAAIFNASISSLLGMFLTPLLVGLLAAAQGQALALRDGLAKVALLVLLPFAAGQLLRPIVGERFERLERHVTTFDRGVVLLLVWVAFSDSAASGLWTRHGTRMVAEALAGAAVLLAVALWLTHRAGRLLRLPAEDGIALVFCGSNKTLATGVSMGRALFGAHPALGVIVLPIMLYHPLQIVAGSALAARWARRAPGASGGPGMR